MNEEIKKRIIDKIEEYDTIIITRHVRPDGDAYGSTRGLAKILKDSYPHKNIYVCNEDYSTYLSFFGDEDKVDVNVHKNALGIVMDTANIGRVSDSHIKECKEIIKIDHHVDYEPFGDIFWVEDWRSSVCEMVADLWQTFKDRLKMSREAATFIYCGMVTDSGRFQYESVCGDTLRLAGALLDYGIDLTHLYAKLYMEDFDMLKFKAYVYERIEMTKNGVAYIFVDRKMQEKFNLSLESASAIVGELGNIKGSLIWIAFIDNGNGSIRVRLRSRFVTVDKLANNYHGGGHECAAGATVYSDGEMARLIEDADALLGRYKNENEGWL